jgi:hypothetical protein
MAKVSAECLEGALTALKNFTKDELQEYVHDVFRRAREMDNLSNSRAFESAMKEVNNERLKSFFEDASIKANNTMKYEKNADKIKKGKANMRSLITKRYNNLGDNIASAQRAAQSRIERKFFDDLSHDEVDYFSNPENNDKIADAYDGKKVNDPIADKLGNKLREYFDYRNSELILSNAMRFDEINEDRMFRQIHDASRIMSGGKSFINAVKERLDKKYDIKSSKNIWREAIKKHLDIEGTFKYTKAMDIDGKLDMKKVDEILDTIFDNITTGKSEIFTRSSVTNDREAVKRKSRMFFKFKSMRSFLEYNKTYGKGDLFGALRSDISGTGNKIGMAELWGDSPYNMYNDLRRIQEQHMPEGILPKGSFWFNNTENYFKSVMGLDRAAKSPTAAAFGSNLRTLTSMARLVKITLQSVSDIGYVAAFGQRMGIGYWRTYMNQLKHIFDRYPTEERARIAKLYRLMVDSHLGYSGRWVDANNTSEVLSKISSQYFKKIGLEAFDRGNKVGIMHLMAKHLFDNSNKSLDALNPSLQKWVKKFMDEKEWDLLRKKNNNGLFTVENVDALTDADLKSHYENTDKKSPLYQLRNDLYRRVYSMFDVASENAVLSPTDFERAWCFQGEAPGTIKGEFLRTITQFKMYTMAYMDRVLVQGWKDADTAQQKLAWGVSMMMGTLPLSVLSIYLDNLSNGVSMPDWNEMNVPEREKFMVSLLAPSLAMFNGILDPMNQNSNMFWTLLNSPSTRFINNTMASMAALIGGDPKRAAKDLKKASEYMLPIANIPVVQPFIRQAFGDEAYLEPGQKVLYGA